MRDTIRIPDSALLAFKDGHPRPWKRGEEPLYSIKEAAEILGMPEGRVAELVREKKLAAIVLK